MKWNNFKRKKNKKKGHAEQRFLLVCAIQCLCYLVVYSWLFYDSLYPMILGIVLFYPYQKICRKKRYVQEKEQLNLQFKDALNALMASLHAGYAVENSMREAYQELVLLHGKESPISRAFGDMIRKMEVGATAEMAWNEFAEQSELEDVQTFAQIFSMAKRSGGGLAALIESTAETIGEKIEVQRDILTILQAKRYEQMVMNLVPLGIILYLRVGNRGFLECLYHSWSGIWIMTGCLLIYIIAYWMAEKMIAIKI